MVLFCSLSGILLENNRINKINLKEKFDEKWNKYEFEQKNTT